MFLLNSRTRGEYLTNQPWCATARLVVACLTLHKKWSFTLRISSVNVTKSAVSCGLVSFTEKILNEKLNFLCRVSPIEPVNGLLLASYNTIILQVECGTWDFVATREVSFEKYNQLKCMQLKVLKSVTRITKRDGGIRTDWLVGSALIGMH